MSHTHSPAEWAQMGCLGLGVYGAFSVVYFLLVDADRADFDPRPLLARAAAWLRVEVDHTKAAARDAALTVAALLMLLTAAPEASR